jgi:hypothetical protein
MRSREGLTITDREGISRKSLVIIAAGLHNNHIQAGKFATLHCNRLAVTLAMQLAAKFFIR